MSVQWRNVAVFVVVVLAWTWIGPALLGDAVILRIVVAGGLGVVLGLTLPIFEFERRA